MRRAVERLAAILAGLLLVLIALEVGTRAASRLVYPRRDPARSVAGLPAGVPRVLAVGDSFTAGREDGSWPRAFAEIEGARRGHPVAVVNAGTGGANTRMLLDALPSLLRAADPHLVVICTGGPNLTNWQGYNDWAGRHDPLSRADDALAARLASWRLVRHLAVAWHRRGVPSVERSDAIDGYAIWKTTFHLDDRPVHRITSDDPAFPAAMALLDAGRAPEARVAFLAAAQASPGDPALRWGAGMAAAHLGDPQGAVQDFESCLEAAPGDPACTFHLGMVLSDTPGGMERAEAVLAAGVAAWPEDPLLRWALGRAHGLQAHQDLALEQLEACIRIDPDQYPCYDTLVSAVRGPRSQARVREVLEEAAPHSAMARDMLAALEIPGPGSRGRNAALVAWVHDDVVAMVDLCLSRGIRVLLHSYPEPIPVNDAMREAAAARGVPFVDHVPAFRAALATLPWSALFVPDGHPNAEGYRRMGEQIADAVDAEGLLPPP